MEATLERPPETSSKWETAKPYTDSAIIIIGGNKRNCKSLLMAATIVFELIEGKRVWSNMPVHTSPAVLSHKFAPSGKPLEYRETEPLDWDLLYMLDESYVEGMVAVDEIGYQAGSRQSQSTSNRLINGCVRQVGHRCLDLIGTCKSFYRIDNYLREETDVYIQCEDLRFSPWGIQNNVPGGTVALLKYYDISGAVTGKSCFNGYSFHPDDYYQELKFYGTLFWDCYDTKNIMSLEEAFTPVQLDLRKRKITNKDENEQDGIKEKILEGIAMFRRKGQDAVPTQTFWQVFKDNFGIKQSNNNLARYLPDGVVRKQTRQSFLYDFGGVVV